MSHDLAASVGLGAYTVATSIHRAILVVFIEILRSILIINMLPIICFAHSLNSDILTNFNTS